MSVFTQRPARLLAGLALVTAAAVGLYRATHSTDSVAGAVAAVGPLWAVCSAAWWMVRRLGQSQNNKDLN